jgi:hypothetical protein
MLELKTHDSLYRSAAITALNLKGDEVERCTALNMIIQGGKPRMYGAIK